MKRFDAKAADLELEGVPDLAERVIETAQTIVLVLDTQGRIVRFNRFMEELAGYRLEEVRGREWFETFLPEAERVRIRRLFHQAVGETRTRGNINAIVTRNGEERVIEWFDSLLEDTAGRAVGLLAIGHDITDRLRMEEEIRSAHERAEERLHERTAGLEQALRKLEDQEARLAEAQRIARLGSWEWNVTEGELAWSDEVYRIFGLTPQGFAATYDAFLEAVHPEDRDMVRTAVDRALENGDAYSIDHRIRRPDGEVRVVHEQAEVAWDAQGRASRMVGTVQDISERRLVEQALRESVTQEWEARRSLEGSLREKETLLREIHHRVKNNLQVVSSLLYLQAKKDRSAAAREIYEDSRSRIRSMALIHEQLYQSEDLGHIHFGDYLRRLTAAILSSRRSGAASVRIDVDSQDVYLDIQSAVPCGLIANELITNALKHAFPAGASGRLGVRLCEESGRVEVRVSDNGVGLPDGFDADESESLGLQLVRSLARQLGGNADYRGGDGTTVTVTFPRPSPSRIPAGKEPSHQLLPAR